MGAGARNTPREQRGPLGRPGREEVHGALRNDARSKAFGEGSAGRRLVPVGVPG